MFNKKFSKRAGATKGFTLVELLIVIAIIAIIAAVVFVSLDPLTRFKDARDSNRWSDVSSILSAIKIDQVDNKGPYLDTINTNGVTYMIGTATAGCDTDCSLMSSSTACVDLTGLVTQGYLGEVPVSPNEIGSWSSSLTGYTLTASSTGIITIQSCEVGNATSISVSR